MLNSGDEPVQWQASQPDFQLANARQSNGATSGISPAINQFIPREPRVRIRLEQFDPLDKKWGVAGGPYHHGRGRVIAVERHRTLGPVNKRKIMHNYAPGRLLPTLLHFVPRHHCGSR
jgi:hypothetical protein